MGATGQRSTVERLRTQLETGRGGTGRLASMEGLRGLAVALVFLVHFSSLAEPWTRSAPVTGRLALRIGDAGNVGVDLFFVLSGFLIYGGLMRRPQPYRAFARRRLRRVYPTYLFVLAVYVALSLAVPSQSKLPASPAEMVVAVVANLLLLPGIVPVEPIITVAWTLSFEVFFYLTVPGLIGALHLRDRTSAWRVRLFVVLSVLAVPLGGALSGSHPRLAMFFAGMLLWEWTTFRSERTVADPARARRLDTVGLAALVAAVLGPVVLLSDVLGGAPRLVLLYLAWPIVCAACFTVDGRARRTFSVTPLRWLGNMSYSYYLVHSLVLQAVFEALRIVLPPDGRQGWVWWAGLVPAFAATVVGSFAVFVAVERRFSLAPAARNTPET